MPDPPAGSLAITIPLYAHKASNRRRRNLRNLQADTGSSSGGPSPLSSDQDSSWASSYSRSQDALVSQQQKTAVVSPGPHDTMTGSSITQDKGKGKGKASTDTMVSDSPSTPTSSSFPTHSTTLSPAMLQSSYKSVNLNRHPADPADPPRLITYTKHSQGFTWNDELFLPSYLLGRARRRKQPRWGWGEDELDASDPDDIETDACEVAEIFVTDEEVRTMMP